MKTAVARRWIERACAADQAPRLSAEDVDDLLRYSSRVDAYGVEPDGYDAWQKSKIYEVGDYVVPEPRDGQYYKCTTAGTSSADQPTFDYSPTGSTTTDGTVTWTHQGTAAWTPSYDLEAAAAEGWRIKAARVASQYDFKSDGGTLSKSQVIKNFLRMADEYQKRSRFGKVGTIDTVGHSYIDPSTGALVDVLDYESDVVLDVSVNG